MPRDPRKLRVFQLADAVVPAIYAATRDFPAEERYGLVAQMRRACVSIPSNIVEGSARRTTNEYLNFLNIATGSAYELRYLVALSGRLGMMNEASAEALAQRCGVIAASLTALMNSVRAEPKAEPKARA